MFLFCHDLGARAVLQVPGTIFISVELLKDSCSWFYTQIFAIIPEILKQIILLEMVMKPLPNHWQKKKKKKILLCDSDPTSYIAPHILANIITCNI